MIKVAILFFLAAVAVSSAVPIDFYRGVWGVDRWPFYGNSYSGNYLWNILGGYRGNYGYDAGYGYGSGYGYGGYHSGYGFYPFTKGYHHFFPYTSGYGYYPHTTGLNAVYPYYGIHGAVY